MQVSACVVCMCSLQMPIVRCLCTRSYSLPRSCHTHNSSRQDFKQRKKEKNAVLLFSSFFFFSPSSLLPAASIAGLQRDRNSLVVIMKSNFTNRRALHTAVRRRRRALPAEKRRNKSPAMPERC